MHLWAPPFFSRFGADFPDLKCLQNLTLSSTNLYIRPSGACTELYKRSLQWVVWYFESEKLCSDFFFFFRRAMRFSSNKFVVCLFLLYSTLSLAIKLHQYLSFQHSRLNNLCKPTSRIFATKPHQEFFATKLCQHLSLYWNHANIHFLPWSNICTEVMPTFIFVTKPQQHFIFVEAVPTFIFVMKQLFALKPCQCSSLSWSNICTEAMNSRQHFIQLEAVSTFIFVMKPRQHSTLALEVAPSFTLKPWSNINTSFASKQPRQHFIRWSCANVHLCHKAIFRGNIAQTSKAYSIVARHQDFRDANKMLKMQGVPIKTLKMQGLLIKISKMPMKPWSFKKNAAKTLKMQEDANKTLKFQEEYRQDFDIAWTCPWRRDDATPTSDAERRWHCSTFGDMIWNCTTQKGDDVA